MDGPEISILCPLRSIPSISSSASGGGSISASDSDKLERFSQFGELSLSNGTERMLVYVDGSVTNVRISLSTGNNNSEKVVVFAVAGLGQQDAIIVEASQDVFQNLTFQYDTNGETAIVTP